MSFIVPASARSWVPGADQSWFPIQNLPFGMALDDEGDEMFIVRLGDFAIDIQALIDFELLPSDIDVADPVFLHLSMGSKGLSLLRKSLFELFESNAEHTEARRQQIESTLVPLDEVELQLPMTVTSFVDFYSGIHHASNVGKMFRPDMPPLLPNYRHIPIGYNGRASSVVLSGTPIMRPSGQTKGPNDELPSFGPTKELDFELELGFYTLGQTEMGHPCPIGEVQDLMYGLVLVNDWSARDVQRWEYQPLGPFLAKSFATSISPWIVPFDALEPFAVNGLPQDPSPLPHLQDREPRVYDIHLEVLLKTARAKSPQSICKSNAKHLYWSFRQQLAHQCSNGTPIDYGDLYASGTISGAEEGTFGSLLELSWKGSKPLTIEETGETRTFLEDGDTLIMRGWCEGEGYKVGLGEVTGTVISQD